MVLCSVASLLCTVWYLGAVCLSRKTWVRFYGRDRATGKYYRMWVMGEIVQGLGYIVRYSSKYYRMCGAVIANVRFGAVRCGIAVCMCTKVWGEYEVYCVG